MDTTLNVTTAPARSDRVAIDTRLSEISERLGHLSFQKARLRDQMHRAAGDRRVPNPTDKWGADVWEMDFDKTVVFQIATHVPALYAEYVAVIDEIDSLGNEVQALNAVYLEYRWTRFFLVTNVDGHIHSSVHCSTCHATTEFAWLTDLSDQTEAEAVEAHGAILCSVCYPTAPVEWTNGESHAKRAKREEIEARKAERLAKKIEKALLPNAEPLVLEREEGDGSIRRRRIETLAQARTWLREVSDTRAEVLAGFWTNGTEHEILWRSCSWECWTPENEARVVDAIAAKTRSTRGAVAAEAAAKAAKKAEKNRL